MTANKHTPSPWCVQQAEDCVGRKLDGLVQWVVTSNDHDLWISTGPTWDSEHAEESEANARLIAAAPELLEILRKILPFVATQAIGCHGDKCREEWCFSCNGEEDAEAAAKRGCELFAEAHAAIAKATGGAA